MGILLGTILLCPYVFSSSVTIAGESLSDPEKGVVEIRVFPNPSNGRFHLTIEDAGKEKVTAKVYDITGKLISDVSEDLVVGETSITADIDLESPASGIYFLRIEKGKKFLAKKIIIR